MIRNLILLLCVSSPVLAQVRTFVSTEGIDNAFCSRQEPCRTFNVAVGVVQAGGEVLALDSGGYGPVDISKSVSIVAPAGVYAAIAPTAGAAITVSPGSAATVVLRNLNVTALGPAAGIVAFAFSHLYIEGCSISNASEGIIINASAENKRVYITDTTVRNSTGDGIRVGTQFSGRTAAFISRTRSFGNDPGFYSYRNADMICVECEATANAESGFTVSPGIEPGDTATLSCDRCVSSRNSNGFIALGNGIDANSATLSLARSAALYNFVGVVEAFNAAVFVLPGTNFFHGNTLNTDGDFDETAIDNP